MKTVLELSNLEARQHFLKEESYFNFDLPQYYSFESLLRELSDKLNGKLLSDFYSSNPAENSSKIRKLIPSEIEHVNYSFLVNKDGRFAWRPFQLIHPALYVSLVHAITEEPYWHLIVSRFSEFKEAKGVACFSIPLVSEGSLSDKATNVSNWWESIEQKSIEKALEYDYILHTDVADCYGSIYTHSIPWALHTKETAKANKIGKTLIGNVIDKHLQDMSFGQTNGIPQGSVLMDFIAEMVLGFADQELSARINKFGLSDFEIIRYRDDYRVFTNNPQDAELIVKNISEILVDLGLRLNPHKTVTSNNVIEDSLKPDKWFWLLRKRGNKGLQDHLLLIHALSKEHPNSGSLFKAMNRFFARIRTLQRTKQNISVLISIVVDIAYRSPRLYPISMAILSKLFSFLPTGKVNEAIDLIVRKFSKLPNTGHMQVWLQRAIWKYDDKKVFEEKLCQKLVDDSVVLWNSEWLSGGIARVIDQHSVVNKKVLEEMDAVVTQDEVQLFGTKSNSFGS